MESYNRETTTDSTSDKRVTGIVLVALGLLLFASQVFSLGLLMLPLLATGFIAAAFATRQVGWLVPGGILAGIGLGAFLIEGPLAALPEPASGGVFLLSFAGGWLSISLLSRLLSGTTVHWPLVPAAVMAVIGGLVLLGDVGQQVLKLAGYAWPLALVAAGVYMLLRRPQ